MTSANLSLMDKWEKVLINCLALWHYDALLLHGSEVWDNDNHDLIALLSVSTCVKPDSHCACNARKCKSSTEFKSIRCVACGHYAYNIM